MAIAVFYHYGGYKCFKYFYQRGILGTWKSYFPDAVSYNRFVELKKEVNLALFFFTYFSGLGRQTGFYYIDSTKLAVCDNHRIHSHRVFDGFAARGKTSTGWFFGLKLHLVINEQGGLMAFTLTSGNVSDNNPQVVGPLCKTLDEGGKLFGDAGYVSHKLFQALFEQGLELITKLRKNMKNKLVHLKEKYLLKKRTLVETVIDLLKYLFDLWHTRHRSVDNAINNLLACLAAYNFMDKKPAIKNYGRNRLKLAK